MNANRLSTETPEGRARFEQLARKHYEEVRASARSIAGSLRIADDLVQDAFVAAFGKFERYDPQCSFVAWVRGIVRHRFLRYVNDRRRREIPFEPRTLESTIDARDRHEPEPPADENGEKLRVLRECIRLLPTPLRNVIELFHLQRLSGADVATKLGLSEGNVRIRLHRSRAKLRRMLTRRLAREGNLAVAA